MSEHRDELLRLGMLDADDQEFISAADAYRDEVRREAAAIVRGRKVKDPESMSDERVNRVLERAAIKVERGEG